MLENLEPNASSKNESLYESVCGLAQPSMLAVPFPWEPRWHRRHRFKSGCLQEKRASVPDDAPYVEPAIHGVWFHTHAKEVTFFV